MRMIFTHVCVLERLLLLLLSAMSNVIIPAVETLHVETPERKYALLVALTAYKSRKWNDSKSFD